MPKGGARNRSGPQPDPNSGRSEARGYKLTALPNEGYDGEAPEFPLMAFTIYRWEHDGERRYQKRDHAATEAFREREAELWAHVWTSPQACAWSLERWRWHTVAMWVRTAVVCESSEATAADKGAIHRFADQIGLTPAGLRENGWAIAPVEVGPTAEPKAAAPKRTSSRDRVKLVASSGD